MNFKKCFVKIFLSAALTAAMTMSYSLSPFGNVPAEANTTPQELLCSGISGSNPGANDICDHYGIAPGNLEVPEGEMMS